ncbi:MAG: hypothetical protein AAGF12_22575 [Myxococcota bacterium]
MRRRMGLALVLLLVGCSDDAMVGNPDSSAPDGAVPDGAVPDGGVGDAAAPDASRDSGGGPLQMMEVGIGPFTTPPGVERTECASFDLGNENPGMLREIRTRLTPGSHHMIVYRLDEAPNPTPAPCGAFQHGMSDALFIAEKQEAELRYPDGSGLPLRPHQTIGIELHYINYFSNEPVDISGAVEFFVDESPEAQDLEEVRFLFTGSLSLELLPRQVTTERFYQPMAPGIRMFAITSHTHALGTLSTIERANGLNDPIEEIHRSTDWAEPPLDVFDPLLVFEPNQGLILTCQYTNTTDRTVRFGTNFDDEMCFLWVHYLDPE